MKRTTLMGALLLAWLVTASVPVVAVPTADSDMAPTDKALNQLYWKGHEALKQSDWPAALERFRQLERELTQKEPKSADAAVYWQAYVLVQSHRGEEAQRTVQRLHEKFPRSRWGSEADALLRQAQAASPGVAGEVAGMAGDDDLAEIAVEGLMSAPPERALPLLQKVLRGKHGEKVKKRALFVLSQLDSPQALDALVEQARSGTPELRGEAIRMLGISGDDKAIAQLSSIYATAAAGDRRDVLQAWLIADRKDLVLKAALEEKDAKLRREAIQTLGAMDATDELKQMLARESDAELRANIVQSLGVAGDIDALVAAAAADGPEATRTEALRAIGVAGGEESSKALLSLYPRMNTPELREAVLEGLLISGDSKAVTSLYRAARSKEEKQAILKHLSAMGDDAALDLIEQELK